MALIAYQKAIVPTEGFAITNNNKRTDYSLDIQTQKGRNIIWLTKAIQLDASGHIVMENT